MSKLCWEKRQPLRIPGGWTVAFNELEDLEPEKLPAEDSAWLGFTEDMLQMTARVSRRRDGREEEQTLTLDLGWYPDSDPSGCFRLQAVLNCDWEFPLLEFSSRSKAETVRTLEDWLFREFMPPRFLDAETFRRAHPANALQGRPLQPPGKQTRLV